jgi:hypothetical protein
MGLHFHRSLAILPSGDPTANGVGTSLHFTETNIEVPDTDACHCDDYRMIQIITTTHPAAGRVSPYVDNNGVATPFYDAVFAHGEGIHDIPFFLPDAGERVQSTISMYDAPSRPTAGRAGQNIAGGGVLRRVYQERGSPIGYWDAQPMDSRSRGTLERGLTIRPPVSVPAVGRHRASRSSTLCELIPRSQPTISRVASDAIETR